MKKEEMSSSWGSRLATWLGWGSRPSGTERPAPPVKVVRPPSGPVESGLGSFLLKMPKVELHVHLEGALRPASLLILAKKNHVALPADDEPGIRRWLRFRDFAHFLEISRTCCRCLRQADDFRLLIHDFMAEQAIQDIVYSEAHFAVGTHIMNGIDAAALGQALIETWREEEEHHGVRMRLIVDVVRDDGEEMADAALDWARSIEAEGLVVGLGLSGDETLPNEPFRRHFDTARTSGLHLTAHAGEHGGPESMRAAVEILEPERIDHGVRSVEDEAWLAEVVRRGLPLTVCPTSNVALGVVDDYADHPIDRLYRQGAHLSLASDGPQTFNVNLTREYLNLHHTFGYDAAMLAGLSLNGLEQAFLPEEEKAALGEMFRRRFSELGRRYLGDAVEASAGGPRGDDDLAAHAVE